MDQPNGQNMNGQLPPNMDLNGMPQLTPEMMMQINQMGQLGPNAMPGFIPNQQFIGDPSMIGMPMNMPMNMAGGDPSMMLPWGAGNGVPNMALQPNAVTAGG